MADPLQTYKNKRNFDRTPEPEGEENSRSQTSALQFVIQKHWARTLHYDFRLELNGTMKSWAVPKGPSLDPADKRMAVQVEDHPIAYNAFEGEIPPGQYGAGKVLIWDKGYWYPVGDAAADYARGKLKFDLQGQKLQGRWNLVRMKGRGRKKQAPWLLIKEQDGAASSRGQPGGKVSMQESFDEDGAPGVEAVLPAALSPQLATLVDGPPARPQEWLWELKFDGYRLLARLDGGRVRLYTRNGKDWTARLPDLAPHLKQLALGSAWLDGEVLVLDRHGNPDFQALQNAFQSVSGRKRTRADQNQGELVYYLFDIPYAHGRDLRALSLEQRRQILQDVLARYSGECLRFSAAFEAPLDDLVLSACKLGFEGVMGKRRDAPYVSGRNSDWIKLKCDKRQEFVIGGYTDPQGTRTGLGSLLLGIHEDGALHYAGNVGTGFNERSLLELRARLEDLATTTSPFVDAHLIRRKAHWVRPELLAEVAFAEWTNDNRVRHAVFKGLRSDKAVTAIVRERPEKSDALPHSNGSAEHAGSRLQASSSPKVRARSASQQSSTDFKETTMAKKLRVSHPDRIIDSSLKVTKMDLVRYYADVAELMMEHLQDRPVSLVRAPEGVRGELFFQRHLNNVGSIAGVRELDTSLYPGHPPLLLVARATALPAGAQMNVVEYHTWNARVDRIDRPDRMTFDLDPGKGVSWQQVQEAARLLRVVLDELGLPAFLKTSGGKGLHVVVPIKRLYDWDTVKDFSHAIVRHLAVAIPDRFVAKSGPRNRVGKVFADYLRNGFGATTVSAWSVRARPGMGVSVPVGWDELEQLESSTHWNLRNAQQRFAEGNTPWKNYAASAVALGPAMKRLEAAQG